MTSESKFIECQKWTLILDVATRWNSQYDMLRRFEDLEKVIGWWIEHSAECYSVLRLKIQEWNQVRYPATILETPEDWGTWYEELLSVSIDEV